MFDYVVLFVVVFVFVLVFEFDFVFVVFYACFTFSPPPCFLLDVFLIRYCFGCLVRFCYYLFMACVLLVLVSIVLNMCLFNMLDYVVLLVCVFVLSAFCFSMPCLCSPPPVLFVRRVFDAFPFVVWCVVAIIC